MFRIRACRSGGFPVLIEDVDDEDDPHHEGMADLEGGVNSMESSISSRWMPDLIDVYDNDEIEEGDRIFAAHIHPEDDRHFVHATTTVSQRLAEAFAKNSKPLNDLVPSHLHEFEDLFSKESFDTLPE